MSDFSTIEEIIQDARDGKMYILVDSEDRENEGDIIIPASLCKPDHINFMATHGRGLICLSISESRASDLKLPLMNPDNWKKKTTAFTVSIESSKNITTGISAFDGHSRAGLIPQSGNRKAALRFSTELMPGASRSAPPI